VVAPPNVRKVKYKIMTSKLVASYRSWRKYRETYNELMRLSPRELQDLGIARVDIPVIARQSAAH
jgi:uncharacterized protein YjiS (DUF1127 family)